MHRRASFFINLLVAVCISVSIGSQRVIAKDYSPQQPVSSNPVTLPPQETGEPSTDPQIMPLEVTADLEIARARQAEEVAISRPDELILSSNQPAQPRPTPSGIADADSDLPGAVQLITGTVSVDPQIENAIQNGLRIGGPALAGDAEYYAVTDRQPLNNGQWVLYSIIGLKGLNADLSWNLIDNGIWFGLMLLTQNKEGQWFGSLAGTREFSHQLEIMPINILSKEVKQSLDPLQRVSLPLEDYLFPWQSGKSMYYGTLGVHDNGFEGIVPGWKAVDFLSDGNTGAGHAPNQLLASASGSVWYKCTPAGGETSTAIIIGNLMYTHMLNDGNLYVGRYFNQGEYMGQMKSGTFSENCGWASQGSDWFHVHWGFPNTGSHVAEGWTLTFYDSVWRRNGESRYPGDWMLAEGNEPPPTCPSSGGVLLYKNAGYDCGGEGEGYGYVLRSNTGFQDVPGTFNDQASSLRVPSGWSVKLYENSGAGGASVCRSGDDSDFSGDYFDGGAVPLNDRVSSFEVFNNTTCGGGQNEVRLYDGTNYSGDYVYATEPGLYTLEPNFNDRAESLSMPSGWAVRLFEHNDYYGPQVCIVGNDSSLWDNTYSNGDGAANSATWLEIYAQASCPPIGNPPAPPTLASPPNGSTLSSTDTVSLAWNASEGATDYYAHLWGGPSIDINSGWIPSTSWEIGTLWPGSYQWEVKARNGYGESAYSSPAWSFTVENLTEVRLYNGTDYGGTYVYATSPGLYTLEGVFDNAAESIMMPSGWSVRLFEVNDYYGPHVCIVGNDPTLWDNTFNDGRVVANRTTWLEIYDLPNCPAPLPPSLALPPNSASMDESVSISLVWNSSSGATEYYTHLWGGSGTDINSGWIVNTAWNVGRLTPGDYQWQVNARNSSGESGFSELWSFTIRENTVKVIDVWTSDEVSNPKTTFDPGEVVRWVIDLENTTGASANISLTFDVVDPVGGQYFYWRGTITVGVGLRSYYLDATAPSGQGGTYSFTGSGMYLGNYTEDSATYVVNASPPDLIFLDGFELGNLTAWSAKKVDQGDLSVSTAAKLVGHYGMQAIIDDNVTLYVADDTPTAESSYRARFYFDPNTISMASGDTHAIFYGYSETARVVLRVEFQRGANNYQLRVGILKDDLNWVDGIWKNITDKRHPVELFWHAATGPGMSDGGLSFWIDGVLMYDLTSVDNDTWNIGSVRLGPVSGIDTTTRGTIYFDAFKSTRTTYIGP